MGGAGGRVPPGTSDREISADLPGKRRQGKKEKGVKIEKKRRKIVKGKKVEKLQNEERTSPPPFFFFFLFKTPKVCFGSTKMEIFYREKKHFMPEKKSGKMTTPSEKFCCYAFAHEMHGYQEKKKICTWIRRKSDYIIGLITPLELPVIMVIGPNKS